MVVLFFLCFSIAGGCAKEEFQDVKSDKTKQTASAEEKDIPQKGKPIQKEQEPVSYTHLTLPTIA